MLTTTTAPASTGPVTTPARSPVPWIRAGILSLNLCLVGAIVWLTLPVASEAETALPAVVAPPAPPAVEPLGWAPPAWFPEDTADQLWVLPELDDEPVFPVRKGPKLRSHGVIVADLDLGEVLYARRADDLRPVASLTKLVSALALASTGAELDRQLCVTRREWPSRSGARSRFETGVCHDGAEFLGAALVASDNRGAMGLATLSGLPYESFLHRMRDVAAELRMEGDTWSDPSGLEDDNLATARDMLKAVTAVAAHPQLASVASAEAWLIDRERGPQRLGTTNRLVKRWDTLAAKTGYTDTARYCFATVVRTRSGRTLAVSVLGAPTGSARFSDTAALVNWAESTATPEAVMAAKATERIALR